MDQVIASEDQGTNGQKVEDESRKEYWRLFIVWEVFNIS